MSLEQDDVAMPKLTLPYDQTVLVLQGGGALGSYQGGAYEVLHSHGVEPDWIAGISIGAINAAIIAGNAPQDRIGHLREFWNEMSTDIPGGRLAGDLSSQSLRQFSGFLSLAAGVKAMFRPWFMLPWFNRPGTPEATSFYDTRPLRETLLRHVDFDRINAGRLRLSLGAVNVRTGNFAYFDNRDPGHKIKPEHIMASAALPPGFPAVEIDGEAYWDGGLVSNTPLSYVLDSGVAKATLVFQIDLFSAVGPLPQTMDEVQERVKDITYSSRTRMNTDAFLEKYRLRHAIRALAEHVSDADRKRLCEHKLPADFFSDTNVSLTEGANGRVSLVHIINRSNRHEIQSKDFDFWRESVREHWRDGMADAREAMQAKAWRGFADPDSGLAVYDYIRPDPSRP
ncbi:patatin-like phospholipase family protein [Asticcacaulis sp. AC402]|uniref:patatin-like phospholipase family protein n=1 Tax=Asticcacaulis sp. AC402 TaxID=1282361 RepID=UPI0004022393|nr:patatin-like phospholipase family protein [Asticcacaulis sp. AC402]